MTTIAGLPAHPLFVHLAVVAIAVAALLAILAAIWPAARTRLGFLTPLVAVVALIVTPLTTSSGEALEEQVPRTAALHHHTELGDQMIYWVAPLFVLVVLFWALRIDAVTERLRFLSTADAQRWSAVILGAGCVVIGIGTLVMVTLVGDSGARAVWGG